MLGFTLSDVVLFRIYQLSCFGINIGMCVFLQSIRLAHGTMKCAQFRKSPSNARVTPMQAVLQEELSGIVKRDGLVIP